MTDKIKQLASLVRKHHPATILSGAGISVASGLPVYRDAKGNWVHSKPVEGPVFRADEKMRQRYWCRSFFGWPAFSKATPNQIHKDITHLENAGWISTVITQNVDGLHQSAGADGAIALHGNLSEVVCLNCADISSRHTLQRRLELRNPDHTQMTITPAPDGDALIDDKHIESFNIVNCTKCDGVLKPNVVFFGDNVPKCRVQGCMEKLLQSKLLICIGTSLMVYSGFRFCKAAIEADIPVVIVNDGRTRADDIATLRVGGDCTTAIANLRHQLT